MGKLYVVCGEYQPNSAPHNRLVSFLNVFEERGIESELIFLFPNRNNTKPSFLYKHIKVTYAYECSVFLSNRVIAKLFTWVIAKQLANKLTIEDKVFVYSGGIIIKRLKHNSDARVFYEMTEHPDVMKWRIPIQKKIYLEGCRCVDGLFVISTALKDYFIEIGVPEEKITIVNMTVDPSRFKDVQKEKVEREYIAYCGAASNNKDGVNKLIEAFARVAQKYKNINLYIIGKAPAASDDEGNQKLVERLGLVDRVVFTGVVSATEMPRILTNAAVLALARPDNLQAKNGFPTKLGEYLLTGNPVVVTNVGDIPLFLKDGESALMSDPNNVEEFADKLSWALEHPDSAALIGLKGREVALQNFNSDRETQKIISAIFK
ncbi:MAG: glycosyltransferase [Bacteroidales bacterium]|nr:glycosyltransferase [Bacteroidales bacterium]